MSTNAVKVRRIVVPAWQKNAPPEPKVEVGDSAPVSRRYNDNGDSIVMTDAVKVCDSCHKVPLTPLQIRKRYRCDKCCARAEGRAWSY